jgi:hypothetical protein
MKKLIRVLIAAFGFAVGANAQNNLESLDWDKIEYEGDTLFLLEDSPGKLVIRADDWGNGKMKFPIHITTLINDSLVTLEVLEDESSLSFGVVTIFLEPSKVYVTGVRAYKFLISSSGGYHNEWWVKEYLANKNPGA